MNLFFRTADDALYEQVRLGLDSAWGHVPPKTCIAPATMAPRDASGAIVLSVRQEFAEYQAAAEILPGLISSGAVEEIDEATYQAAVAAV